MRFSPVLFACLAFSTTVGVATGAASAQASESSESAVWVDSTPLAPDSLAENHPPAPQVAHTPTVELALADITGDGWADRTEPLIAATTPPASEPATEDLIALDQVIPTVVDPVSQEAVDAPAPPSLAAQLDVQPATLAQINLAQSNLAQSNLAQGSLAQSSLAQGTLAQTPAEPASTPPAPSSDTPATTPEAPDTRVLVSEVEVRGAEGEYEDAVYNAIRTQPGRTTTRTQLQEDINAVFKTGFFSNVQATPEDTPLGVRITFEVQLNPPLSAVKLEGGTVLPQAEVDKVFSPQYGKILNLVELQDGVKQLNKWYQDNGYVLAQVLDVPQVSQNGTVTLQVAEGEIETISVKFLNKEGEDTDAKSGKPIKGRTRDFIVTREFELKPGKVFNRNIAERDLQRVFGLQLFEDVKLSLNPGQDPKKVNVVVNVNEKNTGNIIASLGVSSASGIFGTLGYQQGNLGGNNQKLGAEIQLGQRELLFDFNFSDPWIANDPYRTSYSFNIFRRRTISLIFDGGPNEVRLPIDSDGNRDRPRVTRTGAALSFTRPLSKEVFKRSEWTGSFGVQYQRVDVKNRDGDIAPLDELGNDLSFSGKGKDDLLTLQLGVVRDLRNNPLQPTKGSLFRIGTEQSIPVGSGNIFFNRIRGSYSFYVPTRLTRFTKGCQEPKATAIPAAKPGECPQVFAFNLQAGTVIGDLPPYEAFSLGGSNSVRGYEEGDVGSARTFVQATAEYRFPIFSVISGALFVDAATDFGTGENIKGRPAFVRGKPGDGIGYGLGVRIQSPLGPIRIDYGFNGDGDSQFHFGFGERF